MTIWFTSDQHFGHKRICQYAMRPFPSVEEMGQILTENWNRHVKKGDTVYSLGDFAFVRPDAVPALVKNLNGQIHLVRGNHDRFLQDRKKDFKFAWVGDYKELALGITRIVLAHYPFLTWNKRHHGSWMLHGHSHNSLPIDMGTKRMDIGVDAVAALLREGPAGYRPISFEELKPHMDSRGINIVDHHELRKSED